MVEEYKDNVMAVVLDNSPDGYSLFLCHASDTEHAIKCAKEYLNLTSNENIIGVIENPNMWSLEHVKLYQRYDNGLD